MNSKIDMQALVHSYNCAVAETDGAINKDEIFQRLLPAVRKYLKNHEEANARRLFDQIEKRAFSAVESIVECEQGSELPFELNSEAVVPLGDKTRILYRHCDRQQLELRRRILQENRDAVVLQADREIAAIDAALAAMGAGDRLGDI